MISRRSYWLVAVVLALPVNTTNALALAIYVVDEGDATVDAVMSARAHLAALGNSVTNGGLLLDYSGFDQVWDLRVTQSNPDANLSAADVVAMGNYLSAGGRMYLTGEWSLFDNARNDSLVAWINSVGAGNVTLEQDVAGQQAVTPKGEQVNTPNLFSKLPVLTSRAVSTDQGFLVSAEPGGDIGTYVAWDFGDILGSPDARMLVGFDINIFDEFFSASFDWTNVDARGWTENVVTFLGSNSPVPEPMTLSLMMVGLLLVVARRGQGRRRQ